MEPQYIYLLHEWGFFNVKEQEPIYRIGKSKKNDDSQFKTFPVASVLLLQTICHNSDTCVNEIVQCFKKKYIHRKDIGNEYFEGDYISMIHDINLIVSKYFKIINIENHESMKIITKNKKFVEYFDCINGCKITIINKNKNGLWQRLCNSIINNLCDYTNEHKHKMNGFNDDFNNLKIYEFVILLEFLNLKPNSNL